MLGPKATIANDQDASHLKNVRGGHGASADGLTVENNRNITHVTIGGHLQQWSERYTLETEEPPVTSLSQVIAHPHYTALYDLNGNVIKESSIYPMPPNAPKSYREKFAKSLEIVNFEPQAIEVPALARCDEEVVFGGAPHHHFGHHLLDGMSRMWFHSDKPTLSLDIHLNSRPKNRFIREFRALGRPRNFYGLQSPTLFEKVVLPHASIQHAFLIYKTADAEHLEITRSALKLARDPVPSKIYLSRKGIVNRPCYGEEELERRLSSLGFAIVSPETMPLVEQISMFNRAEWIVGPMSSAFHNLMFTPAGSSLKTVQFTWEKPDLRCLLVDELKGQKSYYARTMSFEKVTSKTVTQINTEESLYVLRSIGAL